MSFKQMKTYVDKPANLDHRWYLIDAQDLILGRLTTEVARLLVGKHKPTYTPHMDNGDWVVVINADLVRLTGNKEEAKIYYRYTGYRGGIKQRTVAEQRKLDSRQLIYMAVKGMLPKNKLQAHRLNRLKIYPTAEHKHDGQSPTVFKVNKEAQDGRNQS